MPLTTETIVFEDALEAKLDEREEIADQAAKIESDNPAFADLARDGNKLDGHISALRWAIDNWDVDEITVSGLTGGEYAHLQNEVQADGEGPGDIAIATVVHGTEDAPYLDEDEGATYRNVGQLPVAVLEWIEDEVNNLTSVSGNGDGPQTFAQLVAEKRHQEAGTNNSESSGS